MIETNDRLGSEADIIAALQRDVVLTSAFSLEAGIDS